MKLPLLSGIKFSQLSSVWDLWKSIAREVTLKRSILMDEELSFPSMQRWIVSLSRALCEMQR